MWPTSSFRSDVSVLFSKEAVNYFHFVKLINLVYKIIVLFQEHEIGAWVSRVVPNGNGARKGVQPGDQLASIDGKSAVHASIDEVAAIISRTPKKKSVELTFLR